MTSLAIRIEGLGKEYHIGGLQDNEDRSLAEIVSSGLLSPFQRLADIVSGRAQSASGLKETFWALKDISLEVKHGEVVGIIGRNGAGKSTLLKILSRITEPTEGRIELYGRVGSLLEVGTGFHPELTGRENIYMNGVILGMRKAEIDRKFDEIVAFSEIEQFIDTPVKHYSSGMSVRLAFAVAAHLEPEILVIDEVLAVGDVAFQRKCLGKMNDVAGEGRTVLFVSHNMSAINNLCTRGVVLERGQLLYDGKVEEAVANYLYLMSEDFSTNQNPIQFPVKPQLKAQILEVGLKNHQDEYTHSLDYSHPFSVELILEVREFDPQHFAALTITDTYGNIILFTSDEDMGEAPIANLHEGQLRYHICFPAKLLKPGSYYLSVVIAKHPSGKIDRYDNLMLFEIQDTDSYRAMKGLYRRTAIIAPEIPWVYEPT